MKYTGQREVGPKTLNAVRRTMHRLNRPVRVVELVSILQKSDPTIRHALSQLGAVEDKSVWPRVWSLPDDAHPLRIITNSDDTVTVKYSLLEPQVPRWNESRAKFARNLAAIEISPESDPALVAEQLQSAASVLASLSYDILQSMDYVDWFVKLGGETDEGA